MKPNIKLAMISSYEGKIIRLFCCKSSIIIMNISYSSEKRMKGNRKELVMKFVHECSNINCDKIIEFDCLKRFDQRAGRTISFPNNARMKNRRDVDFGKVVYVSIIYHIQNS